MFRSNLIRVWEGCIPPVNVHLRSLSVVSTGSGTLFGSYWGWGNRPDLPWVGFGCGGLMGVGGLMR
jgi:hypothetical protein